MELISAYYDLAKSWKAPIKKFQLALQQFEKSVDSKYYPNPNQVFKCMSYFQLSQTKVVILGQDPYYNGQATGLSFACKTYASPSLKNILLQANSKCNIDLQNWARQGVLLLNSSLTVRHNQPTCHLKFWQIITDQIISKISDQTTNVVFMLWGSYAKNKQNLVDQSKHLVLCAGHPSPLNTSSHQKFRGSDHFNLANQYLLANNLPTIIW